MSWWEKNSGRNSSGDTNPSQFPMQFELIPQKLRARVYLHEIDSKDGCVPCWSYVTDGLWKQGQKELIFTLRRELNEQPRAFPDAPLHFFQQISQLAEKGRQVNEGDFTEFGAAGFLGCSDWRALLYIPAQPLVGVEMPSPLLAAILLTHEELEVLKNLGVTRVIAHLGRAYNYYPCPPWSERSRTSLVSMSTMQESIVARVPRLRGSGIRVSQEANHIFLQLLPEAGEFLRSKLDQFPLNIVLALLTELDPTANACLVWQPGQVNPEAIASPNSQGSRISGCFIAFVPQQAEDKGQVFEDGFIMLLTDTSWILIRQAIKSGNSIFVPATTNGLSFSLEWIPQTYQNPIDGLSYEAEGGWYHYSPNSSQDRMSDEPVRMGEMILLTSESELAARVRVNELAGYTLAIEKSVKEHFTGVEQRAGQDLLLEFKIQSDDQVKLGMALRPWTDSNHLNELSQCLLRLPSPEVNQGSIRFQVVFKLWGGSAQS